MYLEHFGLDIFPFKITPDRAFLCPTSQNRRALSMLRSDLAQQSEIIVITGDVGAGKTTLILHILEDIPKSITIGLLSNFPGWAVDILPWVLNTFDIPDAADDMARIEAFETFVRHEHSRGRKCVLVVDEAHNISATSLEQLRMLVNVNTGKDVQFMVVLVGQNELHEKLAGPQCAALVQRIGLSFSIGPMNAAETERYVRHRLKIAGGKSDIFDRRAMAAIHKISRGCPRVVNVVCETAMVLAFGDGDHVVGKDIIALLGQEDSTLLHLPGITDNARAVSEESDVGAIAETGPGLPEYKEPQLLSDVFDFVSSRQPEWTAEWSDSASPPHVSATAEPEGVAQPQMTMVSPLNGPEAQTRPAAEEPGGTELRRGAASKTRRKRGIENVVVSPQTPARRIGLRRLFGGTVAGGVVAAGALLLVPLPLQESQMTDPPEIVSMQSVAAIAPIASSRAETERPHRPVPLADMPGKAFLDRALSTGAVDPVAAAIDYARAAIRGEDLAAYYLGQLYETGDGVSHDLARARSWYASVEGTVRGARRRLEDLGAPSSAGDLTAPKPLLGGTLDTGGAEFIWTSGDGADPEFFIVELSDGPVSTVRRLPPQETSALRVHDIGNGRFWRVIAVAPDIHSYAASDWRALGETNTPTTTGSGWVATEAVVQMPAGTAPEQLAAVTDVLTASEIPYRIEKLDAGEGQTGGLQIGYFFEGDENAARKIADSVGAPSAVMLAETTGPDQGKRFPGQVFILAAGR